MTTWRDSKHSQRCAYVGCEATLYRDTDIAFHSMPLTRDRAIKWVTLSGNWKKLRGKQPTYLKNKVLCSAHFDPKYYKIPGEPFSKLNRGHKPYPMPFPYREGSLEYEELEVYRAMMGLTSPNEESDEENPLALDGAQAVLVEPERDIPVWEIKKEHLEEDQEIGYVDVTAKVRMQHFEEQVRAMIEKKKRDDELVVSRIVRVVEPRVVRLGNPQGVQYLPQEEANQDAFPQLEGEDLEQFNKDIAIFRESFDKVTPQLLNKGAVLRVAMMLLPYLRELRSSKPNAPTKIYSVLHTQYYAFDENCTNGSHVEYVGGVGIFGQAFYTALTRLVCRTFHSTPVLLDGWTPDPNLLKNNPTDYELRVTLPELTYKIFMCVYNCTKQEAVRRFMEYETLVQEVWPAELALTDSMYPRSVMQTAQRALAKRRELGITHEEDMLELIEQAKEKLEEEDWQEQSKNKAKKKKVVKKKSAGRGGKKTGNKRTAADNSNPS